MENLLFLFDQDNQPLGGSLNIMSLTTLWALVVMVVRAAWRLGSVSKRTPLIEHGHIQENASSETGDRILWTQPACGRVCGCRGERRWLVVIALAEVVTKAIALINRTSSDIAQ